jgi:futalosine hydrolase
MKILIVCATKFEIAPFTTSLGNATTINNNLSRYKTNTHQIDILITGVGMVFTTYFLGTHLAKENYDIAINAGVAGAIDKNLALGELVNVMHDYFYELGAEDGQQWLSIEDLGLLSDADLPYKSKGLFNDKLVQSTKILALKQVKGHTVNTIHGQFESIEKMKIRSNAQIESMEGAAFLYCCLQHELSNVQIRAISNYVEPRNKETWQMHLAINVLNSFLLDWLNDNSLK